MTVGGLRGEPPEAEKQALTSAFAGTGFAWAADAWYKRHPALTLPVCCLSYASVRAGSAVHWLDGRCALPNQSLGRRRGLPRFSIFVKDELYARAKCVVDASEEAQTPEGYEELDNLPF